MVDIIDWIRTIVQSIGCTDVKNGIYKNDRMSVELKPINSCHSRVEVGEHAFSINEQNRVEIDVIRGPLYKTTIVFRLATIHGARIIIDNDDGILLNTFDNREVYFNLDEENKTFKYKWFDFNLYATEKIDFGDYNTAMIIDKIHDVLLGDNIGKDESYWQYFENLFECIKPALTLCVLEINKNWLRRVSSRAQEIKEKANKDGISPKDKETLDVLKMQIENCLDTMYDEYGGQIEKKKQA